MRHITPESTITLNLKSAYNEDLITVTILDGKQGRKQLHIVQVVASQVQVNNHARGIPIGLGSSRLKIKLENIYLRINIKAITFRRLEITRAYLVQMDPPESILGYFTRFESNYKHNLYSFIYPYSNPIIKG